MVAEKDLVLVFNSNGMGASREQILKKKLAKTFLILANQMDPLPKIICFYTDGV
jgi:hypothetical protein